MIGKELEDEALSVISEVDYDEEENDMDDNRSVRSYASSSHYSIDVKDVWDYVMQLENKAKEKSINNHNKKNSTTINNSTSSSSFYSKQKRVGGIIERAFACI